MTSIRCFKMKLLIIFVIFTAVFSISNTTKFTEEEIRMFLPFVRHWVPPPCPMNELYNSCTGNCSDCAQRGRCIVSKCYEGCDCAPNFVRINPSGPCEPIANCPITECGENEVFRECGPICERCTTMKCHVISCDHKCYCKEGYRRNKEGMCIPEEECPTRTRCTRREEWAENGLMDEFCFHGLDDDISNKTQDIPGCYCKIGYKRNQLGYCINETRCPIMTCYGNEVYHECIPKCNTTCRNYGDPNCTEDDNCYQGCFCPSGYVMNDFRSCIEIDKCSLDIEQLKVINVATDELTQVEETISVSRDGQVLTSETPSNATTSAEMDTDKATKAAETTFVTTGGQVLTSATPSAELDTDEATKAAETTSVSTGGQVLTSATPTDATTSAELDTDDDTKAAEMTSVTTGGHVLTSATPIDATTSADIDTEEVTKAEETISISTSEPVLTSATPTNATPVSDVTVKEKYYKKDKVTWHKETKHENIAKEKEAVKYEFVEDDDGFANEDI